MAYVNRFNLLAGLLPAEIEDLEGALDADVLEGLEYISSDEEDEDLFAVHPDPDDLFPVNLPAVNPAADAANLLAAGAAHPLAPNPLAAEDPSNPWKIAGPRRIARNPNRVPQPDVPAPPERVWSWSSCGRQWSVAHSALSASGPKFVSPVAFNLRKVWLASFTRLWFSTEQSLGIETSGGIELRGGVIQGQF